MEDVEQPESDIEEPDEEDEERDDLQARAAEVHTDSTHATTEDPEQGSAKPELVYAPTFAEKHCLEFTVTRHFSRGTRHWCANGRHVICEGEKHGEYSKCESAPATTHNDAFCLNCLRVAKTEYMAESPERFVYGEPRPEAKDPNDEPARQGPPRGLLNNEKPARAMHDKFGDDKVDGV